MDDNLNDESNFCYDDLGNPIVKEIRSPLLNLEYYIKKLKELPECAKYEPVSHYDLIQFSDILLDILKSQ